MIDTQMKNFLGLTSYWMMSVIILKHGHNSCFPQKHKLQMIYP